MGGARVGARERTELADRTRRSRENRAARRRSLLLASVRRGLSGAGYAVTSELVREDRVRLEFDGPSRGFVEVETTPEGAPRVSDTSVLTEAGGVPAVHSGLSASRFLTALAGGARAGDFLSNAEVARLADLRARTAPADLESVYDAVLGPYGGPYELFGIYRANLLRGGDPPLDVEDSRRVTLALDSLAAGAPTEWVLRRARAGVGP